LIRKFCLGLIAAALPALCCAADRVVTLSPHLAELVCAAGACDKLAGVVAYSDYPPQVQALPQVGDAFNLNLERLTALKPDLVLAWEGGSSEQTVGRIRRLGLRVENLKVQELGDIADAIEHLGDLLDRRDAAKKSADAVRARLQDLQARHRHARKLKVFYEIQVEPLYTVNATSPISEAIALCGGTNVFSGIGMLAGTVSLEAVFAADPDVVVYARQDEKATREFWHAHPQLRAVAAGHLYGVDADLLARATPRMLDGIEQLCGALERARPRGLAPD
jgi:iron complex transport system substrate-binding protein